MKFIKNYLPASLLGRSLLILIVPVALVQLVTSYVFFDRHWDKMIARLCDAASGEIAHLVEMIEAQPDKTTIEPLVLDAIRNFEMHIVWDDGAKLDDVQLAKRVNASPGWENMVASIFIPILDKKLTNAFFVEMDFKDKWVYINVQLDEGVLKLTLPERRVFSSSGYIYLLWVFAFALVLLLTAILFMRNQVRPIRKLALAAERLGRGQDVGNFKPEGAREVRQAGFSFLDMSFRVKKQLEQRALMLAGVSHDLRTPITRMKLELALIESHHDIGPMKQDLDEMEKMINGYLGFVKNSEDEKSTRTDLNSFVYDVVSNLKRDGSDVNLKLGFEGHVNIKPQGLSRCISNIVENAKKYGTSIWISTYLRDNKSVCICIEDDGDGLDPALFLDIFKPFFRADEARSQSQGSIGLGLAVSKDIINAHGGDIWVDKSKQHGGLAVFMTLPL